MVLARLLHRSIGFISTLILARLLIPEDFGLVAMVMIIVAILDLLGAFGFDMALIQNQNATTDHYNTAWTFNVIYGVVSALLMVLLAQPTAEFYNEPRLENIMYALSFGVFIFGFTNIGIVDFRKKFFFQKEFKYLVGSKLFSFAVTIPLAFYLKNYWALVIGMVSGKLMSFTLSYIMHSYRPHLSLAKSAELFHYSKWLLLNNVFFFIKTRSIDLIIGKISGPHKLGIFSISYEISSLPSTEMVMPINRAIFPGFSKISTELENLRDNFMSVVSVVSIFSMPSAFGIAILSELVVGVILGSKWMDAIPVIEILAFFGAVVAMQSNNGMIYLAVGKPKILTLISGIYSLILIPTLIFAVTYYGIIGASWGLLAVALLFLFIDSFVVIRTIRVNVFSLLFIWLRPLVASIVMFLCLKFLLDNYVSMDDSINHLLSLMFLIVIGAVVYFSTLYAIWLVFGKPKYGEFHILGFVNKWISAKFSRPNT